MRTVSKVVLSSTGGRLIYCNELVAVICNWGAVYAHAILWRVVAPSSREDASQIRNINVKLSWKTSM